MRRHFASKLSLDLAMLGCLLAGLAYPLTGGTAHELLGLFFFVLCGLHIFLNRAWFARCGRSLRSPHQRGNTVVNLALVTLLGVFVASSVFQSQTLFPFFLDAQTLDTRKIHTMLAWWGFVLIGLHIGLHGKILSAALRAWTGGLLSRAPARVLKKTIALTLAVYGVAVGIARDVPAKLFGLTSFDYWDLEHAAGYVLGYAALLATLSMGTAVLAHRRRT